MVSLPRGTGASPVAFQHRTGGAPVPRVGLVALLLVLLLSAIGQAQERSKSHEDEYYKIITIPIPDDIVLECGGAEILPDKTLAVSTRHGDIYLVRNAYDDPPR